MKFYYTLDVPVKKQHTKLEVRIFLNKKYSKDKFIAADVILVELFAISI